MTADEAARLAGEIRAVATLASGLSARMMYYAGLDERLLAHARGMAGAAIIMRGWAAASVAPRGRNRDINARIARAERRLARLRARMDAPHLTATDARRIAAMIRNEESKLIRARSCS
jgi:hypothetical protein